MDRRATIAIAAVGTFALLTLPNLRDRNLSERDASAPVAVRAMPAPPVPPRESIACEPAAADSPILSEPEKLPPGTTMPLPLAEQVRRAEDLHGRRSEVKQASYEAQAPERSSRRTPPARLPEIPVTELPELVETGRQVPLQTPQYDIGGTVFRIRPPVAFAVYDDSAFAGALREPEYGAGPSEMRTVGGYWPPFDESPLEEFPSEPPVEVSPYDYPEMFEWYRDPPTGYSGPSSVIPSEIQENSHFIPMEDRWRIGYPEWDRYGLGHPPGEDYPYVEGRWWDPYNQNVLKGDYPIIGQNTFLEVTASSIAALNGRQVPTPTTPFESTVDPNQEEFFGHPSQFFYTHFFTLSFDLFHGDAAFKQPDWRIKVSPVFNLNYLAVEELAVVNPDVRRGRTRGRDDWSLQEWFVEKKLADLGPDYDTVSVRAGSQLFVSDFRGLVFADVNRGVRLFGTRLSNREQFNVIWLDQTEKETNSQLNTFEDRDQNTVVANYFRQDTIWPGYTAQLSFHYNRDGPSFLFDKNDFLARPDPVGVFAPHRVETYYVGWAGDGHINRFNISHAFYYVFGRDNLNPLAGQPIDVDAKMAAVELSYDRDWARFRTSFFWASGDDDITDDVGEGFDTIFDNPNFAGGEFSYWNRQAIRLFGVNLVQERSLVPDLRSSKIQGQSNYVNPGLYLFNVGVDMDLTTKIKWINNCNFLWFERTGVLEQFTFQSDIEDEIGTDISSGVEYRPFLNNNAIIVGGVSVLLPSRGFRDLYDPIVGQVGTLAAGFLEIILQY